MDSTVLRLSLELPLRERIRREHRCPPRLADPRLDEAQADIIDRVIFEVLDALGLTAEQHERAITLTVEALRRAAGEDLHDEPIVRDDQHRPPTRRDQQS
ncbi:MAG: hypothetical protein ACC726_12245 [Chloroflexota bacterium]